MVVAAAARTSIASGLLAPVYFDFSRGEWPLAGMLSASLPLTRRSDTQGRGSSLVGGLSWKGFGFRPSPTLEFIPGQPGFAAIAGKIGSITGAGDSSDTPPKCLNGRCVAAAQRPGISPPVLGCADGRWIPGASMRVRKSLILAVSRMVASLSSTALFLPAYALKCNWGFFV
nr:uncharacterized protein LOC127329540 [Lolium perenne]